MDGQISLKEANAFVRKQFQGLMKRHGFLKNKRTGFYVRIQSGFVQIFILRFLRSLPQIECLLLPDSCPPFCTPMGICLIWRQGIFV